jgi:hypothetical protein
VTEDPNKPVPTEPGRSPDEPPALKPERDDVGDARRSSAVPDRPKKMDGVPVFRAVAAFLAVVASGSALVCVLAETAYRQIVASALLLASTVLVIVLRFFMPKQVTGRQPAVEDAKRADHRFVLSIVAILVGVGFLTFALFCRRVPTPVRTFGAGGLLASGAFTTGGFLGLIFCIPPAQSKANLLRTNTNLVQVSDWLTKILLGASLTQITKVPPALAAFGERYGAEVGGSSMAVFLLIHFAVSGFLSGYLVTKVFLQHAFFLAEIPPETNEPVVGRNPVPAGPDPSQTAPTSAHRLDLISARY